MGKPAWNSVLETHLKTYEEQLGAKDPITRSQARFGLAVQQALNDWYGEELTRGGNPGVAMSAAAIAFGQVLGTMIVNASEDGMPHIAAVPAVLNIVAREMSTRINDIRTGKCEDMRVPQ